jgi:hypothetical protein
MLPTTVFGGNMVEASFEAAGSFRLKLQGQADD